jgi:hypothetical protein
MPTTRFEIERGHTTTQAVPEARAASSLRHAAAIERELADVSGASVIHPVSEGRPSRKEGTGVIRRRP